MLGKEKLDAHKTKKKVKVARFLQENNDEQITVVDLVYLGDSASTAYDPTHKKARLQEHFGDKVISYNNKINARALIGQSAVGYCAGKPTEKSRVFWNMIYKQ